MSIVLSQDAAGQKMGLHILSAHRRSARDWAAVRVRLTGLAHHSRLLAIALYLAVGCVLIPAYLVSDGPSAALAYLVVSAMPVVALMAGPLIHRPRRPLPWLVLAAGSAAFLVGDAIWYADELAGTGVFPSSADVAYLAGYPMLMGGVLMLIRARRPAMRLLPWIDAFSIGVVGTLVIWVTHVERFIHNPATPLIEDLILLTYPIGDVMLVTFAVYLLLIGRPRTERAPLLLMAAYLLLLAGDTGYTGILAEGDYISSLLDASWLGSNLLLGLAALVPSMRSLTEPSRVVALESRSHQLVLGIVVGAVPIYAIAQSLLFGHLDVAVIVVSEVVLLGVLLLRLREMSAAGRATERRYAEILSRAADAAGIVDSSGRLRYASPAFENVLGYPVKDVVGRSEDFLLSIIHPDDLQGVVAEMARLNSEVGGTGTVEMRARHADGRYRWIELKAANHMYDPHVRGLIVHYRDVSAAREARERLRTQATILGNIRESVIVTDLERNITYWNAGATSIFGYTADEMIGNSIERIYPRDVPGPRPDFARVIVGIDYDGRRVGRRKDGSTVVAIVHVSVMRDTAGEPLGFVGVARDMTEHVRTAAELERLGTAVDQASEAVVVAGPDATIEYVNPAFERITGFSRQEVIGQNPRFLKSGEQSPAFYAAMWETLSSGKPWVADFVNRRKDGATYRAASVITPLRGEHGQVSGYVAVSRDLTRQRVLEDAAQQMARERALIADTMRGIDPREPPEDIGQAICNQVAGLDDVATAGLFIFELDGRAAPYGFTLASGEAAPRRRVPRTRTVYLRGQAERGPWIEAWTNRPSHPYNELFMRLGVRAIAYAPVRDDGKVIGFLHISSALDDAEEKLSAALPALIEFADVCGTLLGVKIAQRVEKSAERQRIQTIIADGAFYPVFQPLFDIGSDRVVGYEALTRFTDGTPPNVRFDEATAVGLGEQLELAALSLAIDQAQQLPAGRWLNINASPALVMDGGQLQRLIVETERELVLEVTEHTEITDYPAFRRAIQKCGPRVRLAVDDAGAGFASLRHILELRPQFVKLDRELIAGIDRDEARQALVAGLKHFAEHTGCWLIAEGVETKAELKALRELEIRYVQGYLMGRPIPAAKLAGLPAQG